MKKTPIIVGILALLGVSWTGATWYAGKQLQSKYPEYIQLAQQSIEKQGLTDIIEIKNIKLTRGFLSTKIEDQITIRTNDEWIIPIETTAYHGPLPLKNLTSFDFTPVMLSAQSEVVKHPSIEKVFTMTNNDAPVRSHYSVSFSEKVKQRTESAAFNYNEGNISLTLKPITLNANTDLNGIGQMTLDLPELVFAIRGTDENAPEKIILNNLKIITDQKATEWKNIATGKQTLSIDNVHINDKDTEIVLKSLLVDADTLLENNNTSVSMKSQSTLDNIMVNNKDFGKVLLNFNFANVKAALLDSVITQWQNQQELNEDELMAFFGMPINFEIEPLKLINKRGENTLNLNLQLNEFTKESLQNLAGTGIGTKELLKVLNLAINLDKEALLEYLTLMDRNVSAADLDKMLSELITGNVLVTQDNQNYQLNMNLENKQLKLNGNELPVESLNESIGQLFFILSLMLMN